MKSSVTALGRNQGVLLADPLDEWLGQDNVVRVIDVFADELDYAALGLTVLGSQGPRRAVFHPATMLKIYLYGYLNRIGSSHALARECQRNLELAWLTGRMMPDGDALVDFRKVNGPALRKVLREYVMLSDRIDLLGEGHTARNAIKLSGSREHERTINEMRRLAQIDESVSRYCHELDASDLQPRTETVTKISRLGEKIVRLRHEMRRLKTLEAGMLPREPVRSALAGWGTGIVDEVVSSPGGANESVTNGPVVPDRNPPTDPADAIAQNPFAVRRKEATVKNGSVVDRVLSAVRRGDRLSITRTQSGSYQLLLSRRWLLHLHKSRIAATALEVDHIKSALRAGYGRSPI